MSRSPSPPTSLHEASASQLARLLAAGETSSEEIVRALHARADAVDGRVHGWVAQRREGALRDARAADEARARGESLGPLHGLPISLKENLAMKGTPATMGIRRRLEHLDQQDAALVAAVKDAGGIVLGMSNVPLLLLAMETHNDIWGTTHNPWALDRAPGGSSGGEGALIASGQSPWGIGTDIGGSIRIPAAWCGIPGLKPTEGRWSTQGSRGGQPGQETVVAQSGPLARTVEDLVFMMQALGPERQRIFDPRVPPVLAPDISELDVKSLRVGVYEDDGVFAPSESVRRAVRTAARTLEELGATVVPYSPPHSWELVKVYFGGVSADGAKTARALVGPDQAPTPQLATLLRLGRLPAWLRGLLAELVDLLGEARAATVLRVFGDKPAQEIWALHAERSRLRLAELEAWDAAGIDVLLGPPTVTPPALLGETGDWSLGAWHTMRYNALALPAGVAPVTRVRGSEQERRLLGDRFDKKAARFDAGSEGLPVCCQVIARPWRDDLVLGVMAALEEALSHRQDYPHTPVDPPA